jgi:predicted PurR-regulated permease PerM
MDLKNFTRLPFYIKLACVLFSLFALGALVILARDILAPLIFSCLFAILLMPLANFFERRIRLPRGAASMIAVIMLLSMITVVLYVIGSQIAELLKDWPAFQAQISHSLWNFRGWVSENIGITRRKQLNVVNSAASKVTSPDAALVGTTLLSLSSIVLFLIFTFIYTFFFLMYRRLILKFLESVFLAENKATRGDRTGAGDHPQVYCWFADRNDDRCYGCKHNAFHIWRAIRHPARPYYGYP